jgi:hypothetical protein
LIRWKRYQRPTRTPITDSEGGTDLATVTIEFLGVNDAPDAEDVSNTTTPTDSVSDNAIGPNGSNPDCDEMKAQSLDEDDVSTITLLSGAVVTINADGDFT